MPVSIIFVCAAIGLVPVLWQMGRLTGWQERVFVLFLWTRFVVGALHETTAEPIFADISPSAFVTMAFAGLLALFIDHRELQRSRHAVLLPLLGVFVLSGVLNGETNGLIIETIAWTLFAGVLMAVHAGIDRNGVTTMMQAVLATGVTPVLLQLASMATNTAVGSEFDGSLGFIGGYIHESVFSRIIYIMFVASCLASWRYRIVGVGLAFYFLIAIFLSNYRTTILAALPGAALVAFVAFLFVFRDRYRFPVGFTVLFFGAVVAIAALPLLPDRYLEIFDVVARIDELIQQPIEYTLQERRLFSYRLYLWSQYIYEYIHGTPIELIFGHGPFAYENRFTLTAHSTYVSYLYEYGIAGVLLLVVVLFVNLVRAAFVQGAERCAILLVLHGGFIILNMTTVALKSIDGILIYAVLLGTTNAFLDDTTPSRVAPAGAIGRNAGPRRLVS